MNDNAVKFVYFDVGMILDIYPSLDDDKKNGLEAWEIAFISQLGPFDRELCSGNLTLHELWHSTCRHGDYLPSLMSDPVTYICDRHNPRREMHLLADQLRSQYDLGLLTNMYSSLLPALIKSGHVPPHEWFTTIIDSSEVHTVKPDRAIYEIATQRSGVSAHEIAFVDDRLANVEAARDYGWTAWHFDLDHPDQTIQHMRDVLLK